VFCPHLTSCNLAEDVLGRDTASPTFRNPGGLAAEATSSSKAGLNVPGGVPFLIGFFSPEQALAAARASLLRAQKDTEDAFMRYTSCLDIERQARQAVFSAEKRRDDISEKTYHVR